MTGLKTRATLDDFMASSWSSNPDYDGLDSVIRVIAGGARQIQQKVQAAAIDGLLGTTGETNVHDEAVQQLDAISSDIVVGALSSSGRVAVVGGEEMEEPFIAGESERHEYIVLMDPLDGSSNIDVAVSIGSIFGIWRRDLDSPVTEASLLKPGKEQVAAAYVLYGSSTVMVLATLGQVDVFTLNQDTAQFVHTESDIRIPGTCSYYSVNEGYYNAWEEGTQRAVDSLKDTYTLRYVGSLIADFHRNLLKGGIFLYPGDRENPEGKLRLMYEANPLAYIAEQARGAASSGSVRILDVKPETLHQRTPLIIGNKEAVGKTLSILNGG